MFKIVNNILQSNLRLNIRRITFEKYFTNIRTADSILINLPVRNQINNVHLIRFKYTGKKSQKTEKVLQDNLDDEGEDWSEEVEKDAKIVKARLNSLRMDLIVKAGLNIARNKVENAFYENKIRVNEKKVLKKSANLRVGDEIDLIRGFSKSNPNFLIISRIIIMDANENEENLAVTLKRFKTLLVENYKDPWKQSSEY